MPDMQRRLRQAQTRNFELVSDGSAHKKTMQKQLVVIPLLKVSVASHELAGDDISSLCEAPVENMVAAPADWCPNPNATSCLRVQGNSMTPTIRDGYIVAVDFAQTDRRELQIVIAWRQDKGLSVSRVRRYDQTETLQSDNPLYETVILGHKGDKWRIIAKVLWWIGIVP
jgi:SOS-response transcriptional repressor LexA